MAKSTPPICPKCGYDQSGEVVTWESQCPLEGRCPECGFGFAWGDVLDPDRAELPWYVEHAHSHLGMVARTPGTILRLLIPHFYWRGVGVGTPIRLLALVRWLAMLTIGLHLLISVPYGMGLWNRFSSQFYGSLIELYDRAGWKGVSVPFVNAVGSPWIEANLDAQTNTFSFGSSAFGGWGVKELISPMALLFGMALLWLVVLLAVPVTRRQVKLRTGHVARAALISVLAMVLAYQCARLADGLDYLTQVGFLVDNQYGRLFGGVVMPALVLWLSVFWITAIVTGWRVQRCRALIVLGTIASLLGGVVMLYFALTMFGWS